MSEVNAPPSAGATPITPKSKDTQPSSRVPISLLVLTLMGVLGTLTLGLQWWNAQQALQKERNLALIEKLRQRALETKPADATTAVQEAQEPIQAPSTIQQLEPVTIPIRSQSPPEAAALVPATPEPLLVGVVHSGGGQGSAIFQLGDQSLSAAPGESIGNSGWSLRSVTANGAVIERGGSLRSLSVGGAF